MAKTLFTKNELYRQFGNLLPTDRNTVTDLAKAIEGQIDPRHDWDGYPLLADGLGIDFEEIARQVIAAAETYGAEMDNLGFEWLEISVEVMSTEDYATALAGNKRLEEIEAEISPDYLCGLVVALDWALCREKELFANASIDG